MNNTSKRTISTPLGNLLLSGDSTGLHSLEWEEQGRPFYKDNHPLLLEGERQLLLYFQGKRRTFSLPLNVHGTDFQKRVWTVLLSIPYGKIMSYKEVAIAVGCPYGARAVGGAVGKNPLPIFIPCHRVVRENRELGGFTGGVEKKIFLLEREGHERI